MSNINKLEYIVNVMCLWIALSMGPESVNSVLKYEGYGGIDLCSRLGEMQLISQPLAGISQ